MSIKAVIIEDEAGARKVLKALLSEYLPQVEVLGEADSVSTGVALLKKHKPELLFLDIRLPDGDGFEILEQFKEEKLEVIFTTAYGEYREKAFEYFAFQYLTKPIDIDKLEATVKAYEAKHKSAAPEPSYSFEKLELLKRLLNQQVKKIALPNKDGYTLVKLEEIVYCEAKRSKTRRNIDFGRRTNSTDFPKIKTRLFEVFRTNDLMRIVSLLVCFLSFTVSAQNFKHVPQERELGISFNDSMLFSGIHSPALFIRLNNFAVDSNAIASYAYRLALNYNGKRFTRLIDTNDTGSETFFSIEPGFEIQKHKNYRALYIGADLRFAYSLNKSDEADDNMLFTKTERIEVMHYGIRPFVGFKIYLFSTIAISVEAGYDFGRIRTKIDSKQSFNGSLNEEVHTTETEDNNGLRIPAGLFFSFHF